MTLRRLVKTAAARTATWTGLDRVARAHRHQRLPFIVFYHRVVERLNEHADALPAMEISVSTLERHIDWIASQFDVVSLDELPRKLTASSRTRPVAAITFDDGYSDVFHHAFPLLQRKGVPAAMFIVSGLIESGELPVHERLHALLARATREKLNISAALRDVVPEDYDGIPRNPFAATRYLLERLPQSAHLHVIHRLSEFVQIDPALASDLRPLTWDMVSTMHRAGMTIGSHTRTHPVLTNETKGRAIDEIERARRELKRRLGVGAGHFAYPDGKFNGTVIQAVKDAGYRFAFTTCRHRDPRNSTLTIPRIGLWEQSSVDSVGRFSPAIMSCVAAGVFTPSPCDQTHA